MVILFCTKPPAGDANTNANVASNANIAAATPTPAPVAQTPAVTPAATTLDTTPNRKITIKSPLYEVTLDSKGALATSWIILKNDSPKSQFPVYADGSNEADKKPMQLISPEALARSPQEVPFRLSTDDAAVNDIVNGRNYAISTAEETVTLAVGQEKQIEFTLTDASGVEVKKNFVFRGDSYIADLGISLKKGGESVPNPKLLIGASIGDHAINNHNFTISSQKLLHRSMVILSVTRATTHSFTTRTGNRH
ncbi:MAG: YidC/Oxa1 family insertase periplasmic-domain containing protein [Chloracidobacterium sp.]|nr:YidC/Oxa1 family insertase periplasmic-domain containing protein [Chloracidobacterium sp.]